MFRVVLIYLLLWSSLYTVFAHEKCARFDIPNVRNNTLTLLENRNTSFFFNITNYSCIKHGNFRLKVAKIRDDNYQAIQCVLRHENFICQTPVRQGTCVCTDHAGTYSFTRTVDSSDSVRWRFWVTSSLVNDEKIEEDVEEGYVVFSVVSPQTTSGTTPSSHTPTRAATVTPHTQGESAPQTTTSTTPSSHMPMSPATVTSHTQGESSTENTGDGNTTGKKESPQNTQSTKDNETAPRFTDTDSLTKPTAVHGDGDANLVLIYIIVGVVVSTIAVAVIISSLICAVKACRAKHHSPLRRDYERRHSVTGLMRSLLGDGKRSHQEVTRLRPLDNETQTQQPAEDAVFQN